MIGHDGGTIGQAAFLRVVPGAGVAVALLTNGGDVIGLYRTSSGSCSRAGRGRAAGLPVPPAGEAVDPTPYLGSYAAIGDVTVARTTTAGLARPYAQGRPRRSRRRAGATLAQSPRTCLISIDQTTASIPLRLHRTRRCGAPQYVHYGRVIARVAE